MDARIIDGDIVITFIRPGSVADAASLRPGFTIETAGESALAKERDSFRRIVVYAVRYHPQHNRKARPATHLSGVIDA